MKTDIPMSLEEIIQACQDKYQNKTPLQLFSLMRVQIARLYCDNFLNTQTMKELWWLFYMSTMENKKWSSNKGDWVDV